MQEVLWGDAGFTWPLILASFSCSYCQKRAWYHELIAFKYLQRLGVDTDAMLLCQPDSGEMALEVADQLVRSQSVDIIAVDSVAALVPRSEIEGEIGNSQRKHSIAMVHPRSRTSSIPDISNMDTHWREPVHDVEVVFLPVQNNDVLWTSDTDWQMHMAIEQMITWKEFVILLHQSLAHLLKSPCHRGAIQEVALEMAGNAYLASAMACMWLQSLMHMAALLIPLAPGHEHPLEQQKQFWPLRLGRGCDAMCSGSTGTIDESGHEEGDGQCSQMRMHRDHAQSAAAENWCHVWQP